MTTANPTNVPARGLRPGDVIRRSDHGVTVIVVRDFAHLKAGWEVARKESDVRP